MFIPRPRGLDGGVCAEIDKNQRTYEHRRRPPRPALFVSGSLKDENSRSTPHRGTPRRHRRASLNHEETREFHRQYRHRTRIVDCE